MQARYRDAAGDFRTALTLKPSLWNAQAYLGLSDLRLGRVQDAAALFKTSFPHLQDTKLRAQVGLELIRVYYEAKEFDQAVNVLRMLQKTNPNDPDILYTLYRTYSDLAAQALATLAQVAPDSVRLHQVLAQALESQEDISGAIMQYRKVLDIDPHLLGTHYELGRLILATSQQEPARQEAEKEFEAELRLNPTDANSEYELGGIYWLRSELEVAAQHYTRALEFKPDLVDAHIALGKVLMAQGRLDKALDHFLDATRVDPQSEAAHYRLAQTYRKLGRTQDADREWAVFEQLRDSEAPLRALYQQTLQRRTTRQTVEDAHTKP